MPADAIVRKLPCFCRPSSGIRSVDFSPQAWIQASHSQSIKPSMTDRHMRFFSSCIFNASPRISLVNTSKLAGVPASSVFSPLTIDS